MPAPRSVTVAGKSYPSISAACVAYGHRNQMVHYRMSTGMTLEQALTAPRRYTGAKSHPSYATWNSIRSRCYSKGCGGYKTHGARGVRVCARWLNDFWDFVEDMGVRPSKAHSIDRINNDLGYEPGNCRWVTNDVQQRNRRNNRIIEYRGERLCIKDWAARYGMHASTVSSRLNLGWTIEAALKTQTRKRFAERLERERAAGAAQS